MDQHAQQQSQQHLTSDQTATWDACLQMHDMQNWASPAAASATEYANYSQYIMPSSSSHQQDTWQQPQQITWQQEQPQQITWQQEHLQQITGQQQGNATVSQYHDHTQQVHIVTTGGVVAGQHPPSASYAIKRNFDSTNVSDTLSHCHLPPAI